MNTAVSPSFTTANPHALATILEAARVKTIIASRDIFDISGMKLWAREQPVSEALQRKLLDRKLRNPLESCLMAEDGVTPLVLAEAVRQALAGDAPLALLARPWADRIEHEVQHVPLHSVAQLLLTAAQVSRPERFEHAVQALVMTGALMAAHGGSTAELRAAMAAGLLHDLGEMYIAPEHGEADTERALDFLSYQHLVVHPHVGRLLLEQLTNYPAAIARAVAEHHERMDGSGYPHALQRDAISPLGRMLAVAEASLASLHAERPCLARASVALRVVPGEFDLGWAGHLADAARNRSLQPTRTTPDVSVRLVQLDAALKSAQEHASETLLDAESQSLKESLGLVQHLLGRLRAGWYASGLWSTETLSAADAPEVEAVEDELFARLRGIERAARLRAGDLPRDDERRLDALCDSLRAYAS